MAWRLIILYLIPVLTTTVLRLKTDPLNDGTLPVLYMARWASTAVAALVGTGYYWSQLFSRFFKPAVFALSFIYWLFAFVYLGTFVLTRTLPYEGLFLVVFDTTLRDFVAFWQAVPLWFYGVVPLYWLVYARLLSSVKSEKALSKTDRATALFLFAVFAAFAFITRANANLIDTGRKSWVLYAKLKAEIDDVTKNEKTAFVTDKYPQTPRTVVVVIGESENRRVFNENLDDFKKKTAFLKNAPVFINDAYSKIASTAIIVKDILMPDDIGLVSAYKKAGIKTFWLSNQFKSSKVDDIICAATRNFDIRRYYNFSMRTDLFEYASSQFDEILIEPLKSALNDKADKKLIFLHLFGSHFPFSKRYPNATETLFPEQYSASARYTNTVLARILEQTQASRQNIAVLYFSDHGTNPINSFSRSNDDPEVNQVPMFLWFSDDYLQSPLKAAALPQNLPKHPATAEMSSVINMLAGLTVETTTKEPL